MIVKSDRDNKRADTLFRIVAIIGIIILAISIMIYTNQIIEMFGNFSYVGVFVLSALASASIIIPTAPMQIAIISMVISLNPMMVAIFAGIGSGIGELTGFVLGKESADILKTKDKTARYMIKIQKDIMKKHMGIAIFILSAIPNPLFDIAGIIAGLMKMRWNHFLFYCVAGRIVRYLIIAYFGIWAHGLIG